jgi:hypothetical protein
MPVVRTSKEVWNFIMSLAVKTGEPVSIVVDKLLAEAMKHDKDSGGIKNRDKKRSDDGSKTAYLGIDGLSE